MSRTFYNMLLCSTIKCAFNLAQDVHAFFLLFWVKAGTHAITMLIVSLYCLAVYTFHNGNSLASVVKHCTSCYDSNQVFITISLAGCCVFSLLRLLVFLCAHTWEASPWGNLPFSSAWIKHPPNRSFSWVLCFFTNWSFIISKLY